MPSPLRTGVIALLVARALTQLCSLGAGVLVARQLGLSAFGGYAFYIALGTIMISGVTSGIPVFLMRETAGGRADPQLSVRLLVWLGILAVAGGVTSIAVSLLVGPRGTSLSQTLMMLLGFTLLALPPFFSAIRTGRGEFIRAAIGEGLVGPVTLVATFTTLQLGAGIEGALLSLALGGVCGVAALWERLDATGALEVSRLSRSVGPFVALGLANSGYVRVDALAVAAFGDVRALALYSAAGRLLGPVSLLTSAFGTVLFSRLSALTLGATEWYAVRLRGTIALVAAVSTVTAVAFVFIPTVIEALYGSSFDDAIWPARILALSGLPLALYWPMAHALNASFGERRWLGVLLFGGALNLVLVSLTVGKGGALAAALCWLVSETLTLVLVRSAFRRHVGEVAHQQQQEGSTACA